MNIEKVRQILSTNDGSLPDINFDFGQSNVVGDAYSSIQSRATHLASKRAFYWSKSRGKEIPFSFGENPALAFVSGDAEAFHVVFGGLHSTTGALIPDLGVFVLDTSFIALDYRMGPEWNEPAIFGLFEIMQELAALSDDVNISHTGNVHDSEEDVLLNGFKQWVHLRNS